MLEFFSRDRLKNDPGIMRQLPEHGIQLTPHGVGGMIPGRPHIEGQLGQGIESLHVSDKVAAWRV